MIVAYVRSGLRGSGPIKGCPSVPKIGPGGGRGPLLRGGMGTETGWCGLGIVLGSGNCPLASDEGVVIGLGSIFMLACALGDGKAVEHGKRGGRTDEA